MPKIKTSKIYQYYPESSDGISCFICRYKYKNDTPMSTLQKHLRVKHSFSVRHPLSQEALAVAMGKARLTNSNLEDSIVNWLYRERIPVSAIQCQSFTSIFERIDPALTLPTTRRVEALLSHKFQTEQNSEQISQSSSPDPTSTRSIYSYFVCPTNKQNG